MQRVAVLTILTISMVLLVSPVVQAKSTTYFKEYTRRHLKLHRATGVPRADTHTYLLTGKIEIVREKINKRKPMIGKTKTRILAKDVIASGNVQVTANWNGKTKMFSEKAVFSGKISGTVTTEMRCANDPYLHRQIKGHITLHGNTTGKHIITKEIESRKQPLGFGATTLAEATGKSLEVPKPLPARLHLEGEAMVGKVTATGAKPGVQSMAKYGRWSYGKQLFWGPRRKGHTMSYVLPALERGGYNLKLTFTKAPDFGMFRVFVNNRPVGRTIDGYAPKVTRSALVLGKIPVLGKPMKFHVTIAGKNKRSRNHFFGLDCIDIYR